MKTTLCLLMAGLLTFTGCSRCETCRIAYTEISTGKFCGADTGTVQVCKGEKRQSLGNAIVNVGGRSYAVYRNYQCY